MIAFKSLHPLLAVASETAHKSSVPELPNFITLLSHLFSHSVWINRLHEWENIFFSVLVGIVISLVFYFGIRQRKLIPSGLQNFLEWMVEQLRELIVGVLGPEGDKYLPFLGTLFVYILSMNWLGLVPFMKSPSSSLNITIALAICVFVYVQYLNIRNMGIFGFLYHLAGSPKGFLGWLLVPLIFPIEVITQISRPITLSLRLFGNIFGEDILLGAFALFGVSLLANYHPHFGLPLQFPFLFLALLASFMQALVFTLLSTVYILLSMSTHEEHS